MNHVAITIGDGDPGGYSNSPASTGVIEAVSWFAANGFGG